jgi:hypothetical protein
MRRVLCFALVSLLAGCAAVPQGAEKSPESWQHTETLSNCGSTDGRFSEVGAPAAENGRAAGWQSSAWPAGGSLSAIVRTGANGMAHSNTSVVSIEIIDGHPSFKGYAADGTELPLTAREWWCEEKALMTRVVLTGDPSKTVPRVRDEAVLRMWRAQDGALIAEQTLESVTPAVFGDSQHTPVTRSYFRFAAAAK